MKETQMKVDVILCCYNQAAYIQKAIDSIYMQIVDADIHLIVADDKSTDSTLEIIKNTTPPGTVQRDILDSPQNLGMFHNYERAFKSCVGDYVLILEGDDYWCSPFHIRNHISYLQAHPEVSMSANRRTEYKANGTFFSYWEPSWGKVKLFDIHEQIRYNVLGNLSACCCRGDLIRNLPEKLYKIEFADYLLGCIMAEHGSIAILEECTSVYRLSTGLWSKKNGSVRRKEIKEMCAKYSDFFEGKYAADFAYSAAHKGSISLGLNSWKDFVPKAVRRIGALLLGRL